MAGNPRTIRYYPPKPIANNVGQYSMVITIPADEWARLDAEAKSIDLSRVELARRWLREAPWNR